MPNQIEFQVNNTQQILVKFSQPVLNVSFFPFNSCWYLALLCIGSKRENSKHYQALMKYTKKYSQIEKLKEQGLKTALESSEEIALLAKEVLKKHFHLSSSDIETIIANKRQHIPSASEELILHAAFIKYISNSIHVIASHWTPENNMDDLMQEIRNVGPLMVSGYFGSYFYTKRSEIGHKLCNISVHQYPKGTAKEIDRGMPTHNILIVGCQKNPKQNLIYYVDPSELVESPTKPLKTYVMSERLFRENLCNIFSDKFYLVAPEILFKTYTPAHY